MLCVTHRYLRFLTSALILSIFSLSIRLSESRAVLADNSSYILRSRWIVSDRRLFDCATNFDVSLVKIFFSNAFSEKQMKNLLRDLRFIEVGVSRRQRRWEMSGTFGIFAISKHDVLNAGPFRPFSLPNDAIICVLIHDLDINDLTMLLHPILTGHRQSGITHRDDVRNQRW